MSAKAGQKRFLQGKLKPESFAAEFCARALSGLRFTTDRRVWLFVYAIRHNFADCSVNRKGGVIPSFKPTDLIARLNLNAKKVALFRASHNSRLVQLCFAQLAAQRVVCFLGFLFHITLPAPRSDEYPFATQSESGLRGNRVLGADSTSGRCRPPQSRQICCNRSQSRGFLWPGRGR